MVAYKKKENIIRQYVAVFFITLLSCYYSSSTLFLHSHNVNNCIVWHSHPFSNAPHSEQSAVAIATLNVINAVTADTDFTISPFIILLCTVTERLNETVCDLSILAEDLRAPPFGVLI